MVLFLTSSICSYKNENDVKIPTKLCEQNEFLENLKNNLSNHKKFVLVASNPEDYEKNDMFLKLDIESLKLSGLTFDEYVVLDRRNKDIAFEVLSNSDLIFLSGGDTYTQNKFFNEIGLKRYLENSDSVIVGISAGSINSAADVYNSPESEEDLNNPSHLIGLGLTSINVEPHFVLRDLDTKEKVIQRNAILKESFNREIIALTDGAYIIEADGNIFVYGESYKIKNGNITKICNNDNNVNLDSVLY